MSVLTHLEAGRLALAQEMRRDPVVWGLGEDLGRGGVFGRYRGMAEEFGPKRIVDTPIAEAARAMVRARP
jgi:pyruvate dehydrogenase E1 component beta subunit